ncbi:MULTISPECIES: glycosyltransferase family 4 protein [Rhodobacterales]|jgi:glycosyltransferase involved in cell wall biosynthesis|uniref:glycosyltransferase family 4 protein n=1 Tax=Rhodobacterales TaxID=204455 RepID=UPI00237EFD3D|nr:glycosyltransferase family 4 protein [Phaeobacter gallaeciensis]MDE4141129.1 glycosyltransferase family 4 protein [Phaeobacter gallaeciensis]MDE4149574.1 glycosyltransferase family 4 protein [Phaeobacter gallaeciensis]MDE4153976.1 glycosyltransferase family 4 protein [Phaeobacter gallaeciensis]MDE4229368.1 glycosyltransferase family 4 protein [Phaeobacter gallaeciensis]MDE4258264.1 glycosyltransferase family 4 protein [Phaeobacter gallaeciensis]
MTTNRPPLAVLVKGWPRLSETFIAQELVALEAAGHSFEIWSLRHPTDVKRHPLHDRLQAQVNYLPEYLYQEPERVWRARETAQKLPGYAEARRIWRADLRRDPSRNRIRRFGQACVLAAEMPDAVLGLYAHFLHTPSSVARYAAIMRGLPWSFSAHAKDIWTSPDWEIREKLSSADHGATFGATCTAFGAQHLRDMSDDPARIDLIYHGLDLSRFPAPPDRIWRKASDPLHLMSVGRLVEKKGFDRLIDALALLPKDLDWHWTHIGGGGLGDLLQGMAEDAGVADRITWRGACDQPEVIEAMRQSDIFVLPSRVAADGDRDGLPNVLMEAASQRLPILSTPVSAIPEFIDSGTHGLLSDDAPAALAGAICKMAEDPEKTAAMAEAALQRLRRDFGMDPGIARLSERLSAMLNGA